MREIREIQDPGDPGDPGSERSGIRDIREIQEIRDPGDPGWGREPGSGFLGIRILGSWDRDLGVRGFRGLGSGDWEGSEARFLMHTSHLKGV